jgi:uncharacterized protein YrrD
MLIPGSQLIDIPVMSLQTGSEIARTLRAIVNPDNLYIVAFELRGKSLDYHPSFLLVEDIRELGEMGMIIDNSDEFVGLGDIISLKNIYEGGFNLDGLKVVDEDNNKLGKVSGSVVNPSTFILQQLNVKRPLLKSLSDTEILIHRSQIIDVDSSRIVVRRPTVNAHDEHAKSSYSYVNPFNKTSSQPESSSMRMTTTQD